MKNWIKYVLIILVLALIVGLVLGLCGVFEKKSEEPAVENNPVLLKITSEIASDLQYSQVIINNITTKKEATLNEAKVYVGDKIKISLNVEDELLANAARLTVNDSVCEFNREITVKKSLKIKIEIAYVQVRMNSTANLSAATINGEDMLNATVVNVLPGSDLEYSFEAVDGYVIETLNIHEYFSSGLTGPLCAGAITLSETSPDSVIVYLGVVLYTEPVLAEPILLTLGYVGQAYINAGISEAELDTFLLGLSYSDEQDNMFILAEGGETLLFAVGDLGNEHGAALFYWENDSVPIVCLYSTCVFDHENFTVLQSGWQSYNAMDIVFEEGITYLSDVNGWNAVFVAANEF